MKKSIYLNLPFFLTGLITFLTILTLSTFTLMSCSNPNNPQRPGSINIDEINHNMPVISIISESGKNDFVEKPVSKVASQYTVWNKPPEPYYEKCDITVYDTNGKSLLNNVKGQVKVRGNWTTSYDKKPLRIKFDEKQNMLGLNNGNKMKSWVLTASYKDWSFLRDATAFYMSQLIAPDYYTTDYQLVEVYINGNYWGVYLLVEQQQTNKNRINISEPKDNYTGTDIGYLLEFDNYSQYEDYKFDINYLHHLDDKNGERIEVHNLTKGYTIKSDIYDNAQVDFIKTYMNNLWKICYEAVYNQKYSEFDKNFAPVEMKFDDEVNLSEDEKILACVSKIIDVDSLVNAYILNEVCCDADLYWSSFYMDLDFGKNKKLLTFEAPWDFDSGLGNKRHCADAQGLYAGVSAYEVNYQNKGFANPWFIIFINCDWFQNKVKAKWSDIHNQNVLSKLTAQIDNVSNKYTTNFANNYARWGNINRNDLVGGELNNKPAACKTQKEAADYLKSWLTTRFTALDGLWLN